MEEGRRKKSKREIIELAATIDGPSDPRAVFEVDQLSNREMLQPYSCPACAEKTFGVNLYEGIENAPEHFFPAKVFDFVKRGYCAYLGRRWYEENKSLPFAKVLRCQHPLCEKYLVDVRMVFGQSQEH
jgi:hypothetical protein